MLAINACRDRVRQTLSLFSLGPRKVNGLLGNLLLLVLMTSVLGCGTKAEDFKHLFEPKPDLEFRIAYVLDPTSEVALDRSLQFQLPEDELVASLQAGQTVVLKVLEVNTKKGALPRDLGQWQWRVTVKKGLARQRKAELASIMDAMRETLRNAQASLPVPNTPTQSYIAQAMEQGCSWLKTGGAKKLIVVSDFFENSGGEKLRNGKTASINFEKSIPTYQAWTRVLDASGWMSKEALGGVAVTGVIPGTSLLIPGPGGVRRDPVEVRAVEALWAKRITSQGGTYTSVLAGRR